MGSFQHRAGYGCWINDVRNVLVRTDFWPWPTYDDETDRSLKQVIDHMAWAGYNEIALWGLLCTWGWSENFIREKDPVRIRRINELIDYAHYKGIKVISGLGVYSWGYSEMIRKNPAIAADNGKNDQVICGDKEESFREVTRIIDFLIEAINIDGIHLESADLGRCRCDVCRNIDDFAYHSKLNIRVAEYIRSKWPNMIINVNLISWQDWEKRIITANCPEVDSLVELSKYVDYIIDPGHHGHYINADVRSDVTARLKCHFGTAGGTRIYYHTGIERDRLFLPYTNRTYNHLTDVYNNGGRAGECYAGPVSSPSAEINTVMTGLTMKNPEAAYHSLMEESLTFLYGPRNDAALKKLANIFDKAEKAFFDRWKGYESKEMNSHGMNYLQSFMDVDRWESYARELASLMSDATGLILDVRESEKVMRIMDSIKSAVTDVSEAVEYERFK